MPSWREHEELSLVFMPRIRIWGIKMKFAVATVVFFLFVTLASAQTRPIPTRHPAIDAPASSQSAPAPNYEFFSILDGSPMLLQLHHDTEAGTNKPIDVYDFVIELQVMNSDGDFEPVGLQIHNFYTAQPQDPKGDINPRNSRDCGIWNKLVVQEGQYRSPANKTWPYVEFTVAEGARVVQTNEDGSVFWSDDVECWGSSDRFPPF